jgi:hypothetical protein
MLVVHAEDDELRSATTEAMNAHYVRGRRAPYREQGHPLREEMSARYARKTIVFAPRRQKQRVLTTFAAEELPYLSTVFRSEPG